MPAAVSGGMPIKKSLCSHTKFLILIFTLTGAADWKEESLGKEQIQMTGEAALTGEKGKA